MTSGARCGAPDDGIEAGLAPASFFDYSFGSFWRSLK
jgi:hypothetical protein